MKTAAGQIELYPYSKAPNGWAPCIGWLLGGPDHPTLFKAVGGAYGGEPPGSFMLPTLQPLTPTGPFYYIYLGDGPERNVAANRIIGRIGLFAFPWVPSGWAPCDGSLLLPLPYGPQTDEDTLAWEFLGSIYGSDEGYHMLKAPSLPPLTPQGPYYYLCRSRYVSPAATDDGFEDGYGEIRWFPTDAAPENWARCDGKLMQVSHNPTLFSLIGTTYGGDGMRTFAPPTLPPLTPAGPFAYICVRGTYPIVPDRRNVWQAPRDA